MSVRLLKRTERRASGVHLLDESTLLSPRELREEIPTPQAVQSTILRNRSIIRAIIRGQDPRLLAIVGPCSLHDPVAARDYAERLRGLADSLSEGLFIVMRAYVDKPRSTVGWRGLVTDPYRNGSGDIEDGLRCARSLMRDIAATGLPMAVEVLDQTVPQYLGDLVSWAAVGARTSESQTHRDLAGSLSMPVGFKNNTDGNIQVAVDAIVAARRPRYVITINEKGRCCRARTAGNPDSHIVLRGGKSGANYSREHLQRTEMLMNGAGLIPSIVVDCSHDNSGKHAAMQKFVLHDALGGRAEGLTAVAGFMLESNLYAGRQDIGSRTLRYGVSITDECIGWTETAEILAAANHAANSTVPSKKKESA